MREILFRGRLHTSHSWVYGGLYQTDDKKRSWIILLLQGSVEVDPETVGQFTGLTDENGDKIFEGDVVKMHYFYEGFNSATLGAEEREAEIVGEVVYLEATACFAVRDNKDGIYEIAGYCEDPQNELCVIGNIHDNPELVISKTETTTTQGEQQ